MRKQVKKLNFDVFTLKRWKKISTKDKLKWLEDTREFTGKINRK